MDDFKGLTNWIPTMIATGALGAFWFLIRSNLQSVKETFKEEIKKVWGEVAAIKENYMEEEKHALICGKTHLEIERIFKDALRETNDALFSKMRELEDEIKKQNGGK